MSLARRLARLKNVSIEEARERLAQRLSAVAERVGLRENGELTPEQLRGRVRHKLVASHRDGLWRALRELPRPGFFPGAGAARATAADVERRWPESVVESVRRADEIGRGRFSLLGFAPFELGERPDWWLDPSSGVRAPDRHWRSIDFLDPAVVGDHKVLWELNRHQFLPMLGIAWQHTRNERYVVRALSLLESWMDANPPKRGVNWASSLEVALRLISWTWTLHLIRDASAFTEDHFRRWLGFIDISARHIERYLSTYFSPNTHLTGEALGLLYVGTQFPELRGAERWKARGWRILFEQMPRQVRPDGTYFEQATYYHRYTLDIYLHARVLGAGAHLPGAEQIERSLGSMAEVLAWVSRPDGTFPLLGDDDGGKLLFIDDRPVDDAGSSLAQVATLLGRGDLKHSAGPATAKLAWVLGSEGVTRYEALADQVPSGTARVFPDGGLCVVRDGWDAEASVLTIDCGPLGAGTGGHGHADALAIDLTVDGRAVFVDPGTVSYISPSHRERARHSRAHNTVSVDGASSSVPGGKFGWRERVDPVLSVWHAAAPGVCFEGWHDGFQRLAGGVRHRRTIVAAPEWWVVRDVVAADGPTTESGLHRVEATFQCAAGLAVEVDGQTLRVLDEGRRRPIVDVAALCPAGRWVIESEAAASLVSSCYGAAVPAPCVRFVYSTADAEAVSFVIARGVGADRSVRHECVAGGDVVHISDPVHDDLLLFDVPAGVDGLRTDARVAWIRRSRQRGEVASMLMAGGTFLDLDGRAVAQPDGAPLSATWDGGEWRVTGPAASTRS
jgi:hypothetical protein